MSEEKKKSEGKLLEEKLRGKHENGLLSADESTKDEIKALGERYKNFMNTAKIEREVAKFSEEKAKEKGFVPFEKGKAYKAGDKVYYVNRGKAIILAVIGKEDIRKGVHIAAAHIDSPRLDLKQNPLYEDNETAYFKTHYYGGIKKYQWTTVPLSLHGVIVKKNGEKVTINIGENEDDPVFCVTDLLPHLAAAQMKRTPGELVKGEELNIMIGSEPITDSDVKEKVLLNVLKILNEKYGIVEDDFLSAEIEAVPAFKAKDVGFDRSLIGAYGHDDKVCAYTALEAILECESCTKTAVCVLTDKEETGSDGNTGLRSAYLKYFIYDLAENFGANGREVLSASECLSADVNAAFDPTFPDVSEKKNSAFINKGVCITKYTGARGKSGTSDASAEFVGRIRMLMDNENVVWQTGELGKVDAGGGGTVAAYIANLDVDTIDVGVPVLSMHAPYEIVSKFDVYMTKKAFKVFLDE